MSSRSNAIAIVALAAVGIGAWWALAGRSHVDQGADPLQGSADPAAAANSGTPGLQASAPVESSASANPTGEAPTETAPAEAVTWSEGTLAFAEQTDPDPALSRELESVVQKSIDTRLDRSSHEVQSVKCRGNTCQVLSVSNATPGGPTWASVFGPIMRDLSEASVRNPGTGAELEPSLQMMRKSPGEPGFVSLLSFN